MACASSSSDEPMSSSTSSYDSIPLQALNISLRRTLSRYLNLTSDMQVKTGFAMGMSPDWRGLAELTGHFDNIDIRNIEQYKKDPTAAVLDEWMIKPDNSVGRLLEYLNALQRVDVIAEIKLMLDRDVQSYLKRKENEYSSPVQVAEVSGGKDIDDSSADDTEIMTIDDEDGKPAMYDGFVCVSDASEDMKFAREMLDILEGQYKLKLCVGARNFVAGSSHTISAAAIHKRCRRMVIIMSPEFADSAACEFQVKFAQTLSPGSRTKKLIPIVYKHFDLKHVPYVLRHISAMDFTKADHASWFWVRLAKTLAFPLAWSKKDMEGSDLDSLMSLPVYDRMVNVNIVSSESDSQSLPQDEVETMEKSCNKDAMKLCFEQMTAMKAQRCPQNTNIEIPSSQKTEGCTSVTLDVNTGESGSSDARENSPKSERKKKPGFFNALKSKGKSDKSST